MIKVILLSLLALASAQKGGNIVQQRQTDSEGSLGPESVPFLAPPPAPAPEPVGAGPDLDALYGPPKPYSFGYDASASDGRSSRSESSDGRKVTGSYTMVGADGINRVVHYVADGDGFRASIITNEPGTEKQNPSGVIMETSQPKAEEIARAFGPVAEPGPDAPRQYIGAPIPALPSINSFSLRVPEVTQGSASPAFDAFTTQVKQEEDRFEQQQQQQSSQQSLGAAVIPAAPAPVAVPQTNSFSQQIVHSVPTPTVQQQVATPVFKPAPVQVQTPVAQQQLFNDYQPVIVQEIPRVVPLKRPNLVVAQQPAFIPQPLPAPQPAFIPQPIPAPQPAFIRQPLPAPQPIPVARPVAIQQAQLPVQTFSFQPAQQPISSGSLSSGVKTAAASSAPAGIKSAASSGSIKSRLVAPSRVAIRVAAPVAPAPLPALPLPAPLPVPTQSSFLSNNRGKTNFASPSAPIKTAASSTSSGKFNGQRILKPFYLTSTAAPVRFEQSQQSIFNNQPESSSRIISQIKDEQQKKDAESQEEQFFRS